MTTVNQQTIHHLAEVLNHIQSPDYKNQDLYDLSGCIKKKKIQQLAGMRPSVMQEQNQREWRYGSKEEKSFLMQNFVKESRKLAEAGVSFGNEFSMKIQVVMNQLAVLEKVSEIRFWGVIYGTQFNYYVIQGKKQPSKTHEEIPKDSEKEGEGVNYFTYWVSNDPFSNKWSKLPHITLQQLQFSRKIKKHFTGILQAPVRSQPKFPGTQKHYLKAQICRITHANQIAPKGIYKPNDDNPKIVEFQEEVKIPEFAEINSSESWVHRNQMILGLGRCSHYVDMSLPEGQIQAKTNFLTENDPEIDRLRGITEDKVPESLNWGIQNPWIFKASSNNQVFTKDQNNLVYGTVSIRNLFWPGWLTVGYRLGFVSIYIGNGHKMTQPTLDNYTNPDLAQQGEQVPEFPQPYPLQLPPEKPEGEGENKQGEQAQG